MGEKRLRRFVIWFFTIILIAISLGLSIWVAFKGNTYTVGISIAISVIISVINIGMQITIAFLSYY